MANAGFVDMGRVEPAITRIARRLNSTTEVATDSLCCGVSGHLVFLNAASAAIPDAELKDIASSRRLVLLSHAHGVRFRCVPSSIRVATPNLLQGSTGAAYALDVAGSDPLDCVLSLGYCGPRAWS
jgi:lantibiotic modifying enzyme